MKKINHLILIILLVVLLFGCNKEKQVIAPSGNTIKIGIIGPMSGSKQALGKESLEGIQTALQMRPYLDNGDGIELIVKDDQNIPEITVKAFIKLVKTDKVSAIILLSTSASALAVNSIADNYQVPVLVLLATHPDICKDTKFVSQFCFDNIFQGKVAALFVRDELLIDRVAVFKNSDSSYSNSLANEFIRKFRSIEGRITSVVPVTPTTRNFDEILTRLREQDVKLLYLPVEAQNIIDISKGLQKINWHPLLMGGDSLLANVLALYQKKTHDIDGFLTTDLYSDTIEATPYAKKAEKNFRLRFKKQSSTYSAAGFEGTALLMNAMNRCSNSAESKCINTRLHSTVDFEGLMGKITIQPNGKVLRPLIINRVHGDQLEFIVISVLKW